MYGSPDGQCPTMEHRFAKAIRNCRRRGGSCNRQAQYERVSLQDIAAAATYPEMWEVVQHAVSEIGLMEFMRLDVGAILAKAHPERNPKSIRLIIGNPLIMESMARLVPDAASYAPVTVLIDRRSDGVHLSYDEMGQFACSGTVMRKPWRSLGTWMSK